MTAVQTGTAQAAAAPTLLDRMNPVTRLGLAVLASLPILITLDWVSALTMLCCQFGVFVACGVPVARLIRRTAPLLLVCSARREQSLRMGRDFLARARAAGGLHQRGADAHPGLR